MLNTSARLTALVTLLTLLSLHANANDEVVIYRWMDENNVLHFSQDSPLDVPASTIMVELAYHPQEKRESSEENQSPTNELTKVEKNKNCQFAQTNINMLSEYKNISFKDDTGKKRLLTKKEIVKHLVTNQESIEMYCE